MCPSADRSLSLRRMAATSTDLVWGVGEIVHALRQRPKLWLAPCAQLVYLVYILGMLDVNKAS